MATKKTADPNADYGKTIVKTETMTIDYLGSRAVVTIMHYTKSPTGLREVRMTWLDDADPRSGGHKAGTTTTKLIEGNGFRGPFFIEHRPETVIR